MIDVTPCVEGMRRRMAAREAQEREAKQRARQVVKRVVAALAERPAVRRVYLYGSLVYHHFHEGSDIAVEGLSQVELFELAQKLEAEARSPFPLDLRDFTAFAAPFQDLVTNFGELLYDRSRDA